MGNTLIRVCQGDGMVKYYKPPVSVMDILKEHSDYVVVSVSKGKTNIFSSDLDLLAGGKYYILHPDRLLSTTGDFQMPSHCRYRTFGRMVAIYFSSTTSLLGAIIPFRLPFKKKMLLRMRYLRAMGYKVDSRHNALSGCQTRLDDDRHDTGIRWPATSLSQPTPSPASAVRPRKKTTFKDVMEPEVHSTSPSSDKASNCCRTLLQLCPGKVAKVEERRGPDDGFTKEKWLEDMIRGADTQWRRIKLEQAFMIEDAEAVSPQQTKSPWTICLPSSSRSPWTSSVEPSVKQDEYLSPRPAIEDSPIPSTRPPQSPKEPSNVFKIHHDPSNVVEIHHDQQLQKEHYRENPQEPQTLQRQDVHGASTRRAVVKEVLEIQQMAEQQLILKLEDLHGVSARKAASEVLELIEQAEQLDNKNEQHLRQKMDAMERPSLRRPSSAPTFGSSRNFLQKFSRSESSLTKRSHNFTFMDR